ncbi:MAG: EAL domain-containing protein [Neomegalonema sp.]|nr:EAL domain-containing protein [Neomegalonema sp.]
MVENHSVEHPEDALDSDFAAALLERKRMSSPIGEVDLYSMSVVLQPMYELRSGALYGFEALTRGWREAGLNSAHHLFDCAYEQGGLIELEARQIELAIELFAKWPHREQPLLFVNIDSRILKAPADFLVRINRAVTAAGIARRQLCFELSERHEKTDSLAIEKNLSKVRSAGYQVGLDEFGAGVSDIKALYKYDLNFIKVGEFFIKNLERHPRKRFFASSMIELAKMLGLTVIAPGIERDEELAACHELRFDVGQGFALGVPQPTMQNVPVKITPPTSEASVRLNSDTLSPYLIDLPSLDHTTPMPEVMMRFEDPNAPAIFPVVGPRNEPLGLLRESALRTLVHSPYGRSLTRNQRSGISLNQFIEKCPIVDVTTSGSHLVQHFLHEGVDGVIVTSDMRYLGFLPAEKLVQLNAALQTRAAREANPLTHLGGNGVINAFISESANNLNVDRLYCYVDFDNFKPFNDRYGFAAGDRAILLLSTLLRRYFSGGNYVLGHIGGDDFFIGATHAELSEFEAALQELLTCFERDAESLYSQEDREAGGLRALDRDGKPRFFPLLRCSAGILHTPPGVVLAQEPIARKLSRLKGRAKASPDRIIVETVGAATDISAAERPLGNTA